MTMRKSLGFIIIAIIFFLTPQLVSAQQDSTSSLPLPSLSPTPTPKPIEYQLPYPGLLPDSPLYFLKVTRDRIISFLIADPLKKGEFNLLQADKRLNAGVLLFQKGKQELAQSTISKGENYFEQAIQKIEEAKSQGQKTDAFATKLSLSAKKHKEVLKVLEKKASKNTKEGIVALRERASRFEKQVDSLIKK